MQLPFKVDNGTAMSLISLDSYKAEVFQSSGAARYISIIIYLYCRVHTSYWSNQVQVKYGDYAGEQNLFVIKGGKASCSLMGCDWL